MKIGLKHILMSVLVIGLGSGASVSAQTQIHTNNQGTSVSDSFYEYNGVSWGMNFGNPNGNGSRSFGGFGFNSPAIPAFGGYNPNSAARFGFTRIGNPGFSFGLTMANGSNRSLVSNGVSTTSLNGIPSSIFSGSVRPFVTGYTPIIGQGFPYTGGYGYGGYGGYGYGYPQVPYAYHVTAHRHRGKSNAEMLRDSGHVGAHDHGHRHTGDHLGGTHYIIRPVYGPACGVPYAPAVYSPFGYSPYGYTPYYSPQFGNALSPALGAVGAGYTGPVNPGPMYSDGFGNQSPVPPQGSLAAGIVQTQADAVKQWKEAADDRVKPVSATTVSTKDPLGNPVLVAGPGSTAASTATQPAESLVALRKRQQTEARLDRDLRHAAIDRLLEASRQAYRRGELADAISQAETALQRCTEDDIKLKEKIVTGIEKMRSEQ